MALDSRYVPLYNIEQYFVDKDTGEPLAGGTLEFWEDNSRTTPKAVYELSGSPDNYTYSPLPNPVELSAVGTPMNALDNHVVIYAYPYDEDEEIELYYLVVKNSDGTEQFTIEALPNLTAEDDPTTTENSINNELSNSQFVDVLFDPSIGMTISFSTALSEQVYHVAPGWDMVISSSGAGSVTINRTPIAGSLNVDTNPPYVLDILPSGGTISSLKLRQRLSNNPGIWSPETSTDNNGFVAGNILVSSEDGSSHTIELLYAPSVATAAQTIVSGSTGTSGYVELKATIELEPSTNTQDADSGYVDIEVDLPTTGHVTVSSVQVVGLTTDEQDVQYDQQPVNRQKDYLFHYYNALLQAKQIPSYLVGWDFPLNPVQETGDGAISMGALGTNTSLYLWDQTIGFQSADDSVSASRADSGALKLTMGATTQPAIIQYIPQDIAREILANRMCVNVAVNGDVNSAGSAGKVTLWWTTDASLPDLNSNESLIASLDSTGKPTTFNGNWTEIDRQSFGDATFTLEENDGSEGDYYNDYPFSGWYDADGTGYTTATYMAIVIGFEELESGDTVEFLSVSLQPGDIATRPAAKTNDEVNQQCYRYYYTSYKPGVAPGTASTANQLVYPQYTYITGLGGTTDYYRTNLHFDYPVQMITTPNYTFYNPSSGSSNSMRFSTYSTSSSPTQNTDLSQTGSYNILINDKCITGYSNNNGVVGSSETGFHHALIRYHLVLDARLGIT